MWRELQKTIWLASIIILNKSLRQSGVSRTDKKIVGAWPGVRPLIKLVLGRHHSKTNWTIKVGPAKLFQCTCAQTNTPKYCKNRSPNCCVSCDHPKLLCLMCGVSLWSLSLSLSFSLSLSLSPYCLLMFDVSCHYTSSHIFAATANCFTTTSPLPHILSSHLRPLQVSLYEVNTRSAYIVSLHLLRWCLCNRHTFHHLLYLHNFPLICIAFVHLASISFILHSCSCFL